MARAPRRIKRPRRTPFQAASAEVFGWLRSWEDQLDDRSADELVESLAVYARRRKVDRDRGRSPLAV
jgi:hypothetical protein